MKIGVFGNGWWNEACAALSHEVVRPFLRDMHAVPSHLAGELREGDVVVVLGAGDINVIAPLLLDALETS